MSSSTSGGTAPRPSRRPLWLLVAVVVAPVIASYALYFLWRPESTVNYGELLEARQLPDPQLALADGTPFRLSELRGKWLLVSVDAAACDDYCERKLLYMRQLRLTQGKNMDRIERVWLISDGGAPRAGVLGTYQGTWAVSAAAGKELLERFPAPARKSDHIYIVDPLGNLMMRYPRDPEPRSMIRDISRLLRASRVG